MAETMRVCVRCATAQPLEHYARIVSAKDPNKRHNFCKACWLNDMQARRKKKINARKAEPSEEPSRIIYEDDKPLGEYSMRQMFQSAASRQWPALCEKYVTMALAGDVRALRTIMEYTVGKPVESQDDSGPERFARLLMAAAAKAAPGGAADLGTTEGDPGWDRTLPDAESGDYPRGLEPPAD